MRRAPEGDNSEDDTDKGESSNCNLGREGVIIIKVTEEEAVGGVARIAI